MNLKQKLIWIDDDKDHQKDATLIMKKQEHLEIIFLHPNKFKITEHCGHIYLLDDRLFQKEDEDQIAFDKRGLNLAADIRIDHPEFPIYLFTTDKVPKGVFGVLSQASEGLTDSIIEFKSIQRNGHIFLYHDSLDYERIRNTERKNVEAMVNLLHPQSFEKDEIFLAIPQVLKNGLSDPSDIENSQGNTNFYGKWIRNVFLQFPGFVYDSLFSATCVGMMESVFLSKKGEFKDAHYNGIFSNSRDNCLWWKSQLKRILYRLANDKLPIEERDNPYTFSEKIFHLKDSEVSRCALCGEKYPKTVAYNKDDEEERQPVHFHCSEVDEKKENRLYFDEIRFFEYPE